MESTVTSRFSMGSPYRCMVSCSTKELRILRLSADRTFLSQELSSTTLAIRAGDARASSFGSRRREIGEHLLVCPSVDGQLAAILVKDGAKFITVKRIPTRQPITQNGTGFADEPRHSLSCTGKPGTHSASDSVFRVDRHLAQSRSVAPSASGKERCA